WRTRSIARWSPPRSTPASRTPSTPQGCRSCPPTSCSSPGVRCSDRRRQPTSHQRAVGRTARSPRPARAAKRAASAPGRPQSAVLNVRLGEHLLGDDAVAVDDPADPPGPAGLVARPDASTVVPLEVLVEEDAVPPVRIGLKLLRAAKDRPPSRG